jgi:hypothetical protein
MRKIKATESNVSGQLPGDIFQLDSEVLDRAASFGLVPMEDGWIAGGLIAKVALARMRSELTGGGSRPSADSGPDGKARERIGEVDPSLPSALLVELRTQLVKRGLLK